MKTKIKTRYAAREFRVNFFYAFLIFSFIFSLQAVFQIIEFLVQGTFHPMLVLGTFFLIFVDSLVYIIPLTFFYASTAMFSRMSSDRELLILSSAGVNPGKLVRLLVLFSAAASVMLLVFNFFIMPEANQKRRDMIHSIRFRNPLSLMREKTVVADIPGMTMYAERIHDDYSIENISITQRDEGLTHFLRAESGRVSYNRLSNMLVFDLSDGFVIIHQAGETISRANFAGYRFTFPLPAAFEGRRARARISEMRLAALVSEGGLPGIVEIHKRIIFSVMPPLFVMLGAGIGIKLKQQSKLLHIGMGGGITLLFLQFMVLGEMLAQRLAAPAFTWTPVAVLIVISVLLRQ